MLLDNKSIIVVGASGTLNGLSLGEKIDSFDVVIRVNRALTMGYEEDVGTKTDIWVTCNPSNAAIKKKEAWFQGKGFAATFNDYIVAGYDKQYIVNHFSDIQEIWFMSWNEIDLMHSWEKNDIIKQYGLYDVVKRHQSIGNSQACSKYVDTNQTTGFNAIWNLSQMYKGFYITGFGSEKIEGTRHLFNYYSENNDFHKRRGEASKCHNYDKEDACIVVMENKQLFHTLTNDTRIHKVKKFDFPYISYECPSCKCMNEHYFWEQNICNYCEHRGIDG